MSNRETIAAGRMAAQIRQHRDRTARNVNTIIGFCFCAILMLGALHVAETKLAAHDRQNQEAQSWTLR